MPSGEDQREAHAHHQDRPTIGFLLASLNTGASRALWPGVLDAAARQAVNLISFPGGRLQASPDFESQRNLIFELASADCLDGLVTWASSLGGVLSPRDINAFHERYQGLPMISLAQFMEGVPAVAINGYQGMRALVTHLIQEHGFQRLAFIRGPEEHYFAEERYRAYLDTLQFFNLPLIPELVTRPLSWESGVEAVQILLDERGLKPGVDFQAVVTVSDMLALWALKTLQARGYEVPRDVAVTGFNNSIEERLATPPLTTVDLPFYRQGERAVEMLLALFNEEAVPALMTLPSSLVVRQSCGCPSVAVRDAAGMPAPASEGLEPAYKKLKHAPLREQCLADIAGAVDPAEGRSGDIPALAETMLDALLLELDRISGGTPAGGPKTTGGGKPAGETFLHLLDDALYQESLRNQQRQGAWNSGVSALRRWVLPGLAGEERAALEALFAQARVVVSEAEQRARSYRQWLTDRQAEALRETNRALLTTFNIAQLGDVLYEHLPALGIPSAYLVLYESLAGPVENTGLAESAPAVGDSAPASLPTYSRLMMGYTEHGRAEIDPAGWRFFTHQLLPAEFLPPDRHYSLVVEPLYFHEKPLGYAVFEAGPQDGDIYELVRANLSSAIQGALLFEETQQARLAAEKADRIKTRLLANVSHELRAPLNIILSHTHKNLDSETTDPALRADFQSIQDHAEHQLRVINDLLDLSRAEIDELDLALELIDPRPLFSETFKDMAAQNTNLQVAWKLNLPERLPLIRADAVRLRQILLNLLSNARKFTESGCVELGAEVTPPTFHFWVSDTGWGIPPKQQERIFEPFVSIEHNRRISGGIGLGLSITRHLVALHGGKMTLDSEPGKGSTFHIRLPFPTLEPDRASSEPAQPVMLVISTVSRPTAEIEAVCQRQNLQFCCISNQEELEAALSHTRPLAVAWDILHARPGDWHLVRRLRFHPTASQAPFIVYGQLPERGEDAGQSAALGPGESPKLGITSFVTKSVSPQTVLDAIQAYTRAGSQGMVLIVDDDPEARAAHQKLVEQGLSGCSVYAVENGEQALATMEQEIPILVLLDLVMPGLSGADVLDRMRADLRLQQVPVVILSSKLLSLDDVKRLEHHARVILQSKGIWTEEEAIDALNRALFGSDSLPPQTSALVKRAAAYLHHNYSRPLSRWEIAEAIGVSEDYLTRVFSRELEISPWDYLNRYRVLHAKALLRGTSQSIAEIARQVGFKDQAYFSRVFSRAVGVSPNEYRHGTNNSLK